MSTTSAPHRPDGQIPALSVEAITKSFNANVVLRDVNLELMPGSVHALPGHNGSGKSTFIRILSGRFNVVGLVIALLIIAVGVNGLHLVGLSFWVTKTFQGVAVLVAVILGRVRTKRRPIGPS
jgi:ABC-type branched-subunit amino acid transport system ATPase component